MRCPACGDEYRPAFDRCVDCDVALVPEGAATPPPPPPSLGRFHPHVARVIVDELRRRGTEVELAFHDDGVEVRARSLDRERARADLAARWEGLLATLDVEERAEVHASGAPMPGWVDPPESVWVDRAGHLRASGAPGEDEDERAIGPALVTIGALLLVTAWYLDGGGLALLAAVVGITVLLAGVFSPR